MKFRRGEYVYEVTWRMRPRMLAAAAVASGVVLAVAAVAR